MTPAEPVPGMTVSRARVAPIDAVFFLVPAVWGLNFIVIKAALHQFASPQSFNAVRWILATGVLAGAVAVRGDSLRVATRDWGKILLIAGFGNVVQQLTFINGITLTTAGHSALILGLSPVMVALASAAFGLEEISRRTWAGVAFCFLGLVVLMRPGAEPAARAGLTGDLLMLVSAACWALYSLVSRRLTLVYSPTAITAVTMAIAAGVLVVIGLPALHAQSWSGIRWSGWAGLLYSGGLTIAVAYLAWGVAIRRIGAARTAVLSNLTPVVALVAAWVLLGERLDAEQMLGAGLVIAGIALTRR